jgi:hypothetical protein
VAVLITSGQMMRRGNGTQAELAAATKIAASGITNTFVQVAFRANVNCSSTRRSSASLRGNNELRKSRKKVAMGLSVPPMKASEVTNAAWA